ncbi:hypothetical protein H9Q74_007206 [Fusarium xylarioides]|nr:hypothetical protein H9Q71_007302 [Fusarium xylarioides]KAG5822712.1 hypothetical protein H9Q74_007206 [Fusarium xylarioides]
MVFQLPPAPSQRRPVIIKMSDPLSVAASIAGLISITVEAVRFLSPYVSAAKETPQVAAHVYSEVQSTQVILMGLQSLTKNLGSVKIQHAALIGVNQVVTILTDGVLLYSELHKELQSLWTKDAMGNVPLRGRLQSVWKETKEHQEQLSNNVKVLLDSNQALSRRLMSVEDALDDQTIISRRMSIISLSASPSQNSSQQSTAQSPATSISTDTSLSISNFDFEDDLESSRVYRRAVRETMDFSFRSSIARSHNWSVFSGLSLGDVSVMSVIALPVCQGDLANAEHYDFGAEVSATPEEPKSMTDQPLLMQCLALKLKLFAIPGMQGYFGRAPLPADDFFDMWLGFKKATPLAILAQALSPTLSLDIEPDVEPPEKTRKETISLLSNITKSLSIAGSLSNYWSTAKAQVDSQSTELIILLGEQRQLVRDPNELLEIKDELETYMRPMFQSFRQITDNHIAFLVAIERNLLLPLTEHRWAMAFGILDGWETEAMSHIVRV